MQTNETPSAGQTETQPTPAPIAAKAPKAKKAKAVKAKPAKKAKAKTASVGKGVKGPQVLKRYAPTYHKDKERKTAGGHVSVDSNDDLAKQLRGKDLDEVYAKAAKALKTTEAELRKRYGKLNAGMQRMNLGNRMRKAS